LSKATPSQPQAKSYIFISDVVPITCAQFASTQEEHQAAAMRS